MATRTSVFDGLTLEEVEQIEQLTSTPIDAIMDEDKLKGRALKVIYFIAKKRTDPDFTIEQAGKVSLPDAYKLVRGEVDPKA